MSALNKNAAKVIWITGLPGAGKTSAADHLCSRLKNKGFSTVMLDGDKIREVVGKQNAYTKEERLRLSLLYARLAKMICEQGHIVIVATVSLFHSVHAWNRQNIPEYFEVFLDINKDTLRKRDQKKLYSSFEKGLEKNMIGVNIAAEFPQTPDIVITSEMNFSPSNIAEKIIEMNGLKENKTL